MTDKTATPLSALAFPNALFGMKGLTESINKVLQEDASALDAEISSLLEEFKAIDKAGELNLAETQLKARERIVQEMRNYYGDWKTRHGNKAKAYLYEVATKKVLDEMDTGGSNGSDAVRAKVVGVENTSGLTPPPSSQTSKSEKWGFNREKEHRDEDGKSCAKQDVSPGPFHDEENVFGHGKKLSSYRSPTPGQNDNIKTKVDGGTLAEAKKTKHDPRDSYMKAKTGTHNYLGVDENGHHHFVSYNPKGLMKVHKHKSYDSGEYNAYFHASGRGN